MSSKKHDTHALLALLETASRPPANATAADLVEQGVALYDLGKPEEAMLRYKQALSQEPTHPAALYELAMTCTAMGRYGEAVDLCQRLLRENPAAPPALYATYGTCLDGLGKPAEAAEVYQQGLERYPDNGALHYNLGVTQATTLNQPLEALRSMQQALRCRPAHPGTVHAIGQLQQQGNRIPMLLVLLRQLQLEPTGRRADAALARLDALKAWGIEKHSEKAVTIRLSAIELQNAGDKGQPDNFTAADALLALDGVLDDEQTGPPKTASERLTEKLDRLIQVLEELQPEKQTGFIWQFLVPYFVELKNQGHLPALVYVTQASRAASTTPDVQAWLQDHPAPLADLRNWSAAYRWPTP